MNSSTNISTDNMNGSTNISTTNSTANILDFTVKEPKRKACFRNIRIFTAILAILSCVNGAIAAAYLPSIITTIEQIFELDSSISGLIVGSYEIGATVSVIIVSYLGHHRHIPLIIGWGTVIIAIGSALFSVPHFISPNYSETLLQSFGENATSVDKNTTSFCDPWNSDINATDTPTTCTTKTFAANRLYLALFIIAQMSLGIGSSPILTIGLSYIDNFVDKKVSAEYIAAVYAASILGAVIGFGCGAAMLEIYVDILTQYKPVILNLNSNDDLWVGAWWGGYLLFAVILLAMAPLLCLFPKSMATEDKPGNYDKKSIDEDATINPSSGLTSGKLSEFPKSVLLLVKNPVYMLINLGSVCAMTIVTGFTTFAAKYFETQFYVKRSIASIITGAAAVPAAVIGIVVMGVIMKKFKIGELGAIKSILILNVIAIGGFIVSFFLGCKNLDIAGVTVPYPSNNTDIFHGVNVTNSCNKNCYCDEFNFKAVCDVSNSLTYVSHCHAGCISDSNGQIQECSCVANDHPVVKDLCDADCDQLYIYMIVLIIVSFCVAGVKTPITILTLRCVSDELKSFGLGVQVMIIRLLALLPAPIIYGAIIDSSCLWWKEECGERLNCLVYENSSFTFRFQGLSLAVHLLGTLFFGIAWLIMRANPPKEVSEKDDTSECEVTVTRL